MYADMKMLHAGSMSGNLSDNVSLVHVPSAQIEEG